MKLEIITQNKLLWINVLLIIASVIFYGLSDLTPLREILVLLSFVCLIIQFIFRFTF